MIYYVIIAFQAYCIFHVYRNRNEHYWYVLIFFIPVVGAVMYFLRHILNRRKIRSFVDSITALINPRKKIKDSQKRLKASNTFQNKVNLADAFKEKKDFENAIYYYEQALNNKSDNNESTINKVLECSFEIRDYKKVVEYGARIDLENNFKDSLCIYAISLEKCDDLDTAETYFRKTNKRYTNYAERLEFIKFLIRVDKKTEAKTVLEEYIFEIDNMIEANKKNYKFLYLEAKKILTTI
ncbi:hypothetical protein [Polaribacter porphyrae]|uniref:Uncharacterized protein n=1 Tax=Polaribacter porphyrae TaxID=1137780 RepID=A0A2S7WPQ6_9FLAO|nr:hypothetical protein [Polaribacter porphyrae]PQJ79302.1 hypothetical protein BTO18_09010 [Polaribacter porphyrae]